jgi:hypothetical protein
MKKTPTASGYIFKPMPSKYHDEKLERRARQHIEELTTSLNEYIARFCSNGVSVNTEDELRQLTPEVVREQIQATRQRRLGERFLPSSIREAEEREFNRMERTLVPLAEELQDLLKRVPFPIHLGTGKDDTFFGDGVEEYIEKAATVEIPEGVINYYDQMQKVCAAWFDLCKWTEVNGFAPPSREVIQTLTDCAFKLEPEQMFSWWQFQTITKI